MKKPILLLIAASILTGSEGALAGEWSFAGYSGVETRAFLQDGVFSEQDKGFDFSLVSQPEVYWRSDDDRQRASLVAFLRADTQDGNRTHVDIREAFWGFEGGSTDWIVGLNRVFWGVTESRHLVDVINQTDLIEDIDQEDKLGQPMININLQRDHGRFSLFVMPWFRERVFPKADGRFRTPLPVDKDLVMFESSAGRHHTDVAFRYSHYFGDFDFGAYVFEGTSREPRFEVSGDGSLLIPIYEQMSQLGIDVQYTRNNWLWKLETIARETRVDSFLAAVGGFEYTFYGVRGGSADLGVLVEYLYDGRDGQSPPTLFDNDLFFGTRIALNDVSDTWLLAGLTVDVETGESLASIEAERRFGQHFSIEARLRAFINTQSGGQLDYLKDDDYLQLRLNWFY